MSSSLPSTGGVKIYNIELVNLPSGCSTYSVEIGHNKEVKEKLQGKRVDRNRIIWLESLLFPTDLTDQPLFYFRIVKTNIFGLKRTVGFWKEKVTNLLLQKSPESCKFDFSKGCQLKFAIKQQDGILPQLVNEAANTSATRTSTSEHPIEISNAIVKVHDIFTSQEDTWTPFLSQFGVFMKAMDTISEVHPYVKLAWSVLSVIPKTFISQSNRDDSINKLVQRLKEVYDYITDANRLPTLQETQSKALFVLVQQTIECAYFLREYSESHIAKKILTGGSIDGKINEFNEKFDHILNVMTNSVGLETNIVTLRISDDISGLKKDIGDTKDSALLEGLPYAQDAGFSSEKCCLPGTRDKLITELLDWVNGNGSQQVLLLLGQAGRGKSAVAHTISQIFNKQNRLGAFFCFSRSYKDRRSLLFSTIARQLADSDVQWRGSLSRTITKTSIRTSLDIKTQFDELIIKPSTEVNTIGPVVIVIDGLDESGDRKERGERGGLLETLQRFSELPSNYRFIITSRPELDIEEWSKHPTFLCKRMDDIDLDETTKDIQRYISSRFSAVKDILDKELGDGWSLLLARRAEGLFQWARTVCNFIDPTVKFGVTIKVKKFISGPTPSLYELYHGIFSSQPEFHDENFFNAFKTIMGVLVIMRKPPSIQALQSLFHEYIVKDIMEPFHSLFMGVHDLHTPIRPLHTSLPDFLTTRFIDVVEDKHNIKTKTKVENEFYIDTSDQGYFTLACLNLMNNGLRFNICNLETSHIPNQDVLDLDDRIRVKIPPQLSYSCYFWAIHLEHSEKNSNFKKNILEQLCILMRTNVLYLFEVLGVLQDVEQMCISMNILAEWCEVSTVISRLIGLCTESNLKGMDSELANQAKDACQFGYDFEDVIMKSTPHLYISALPFAREGSFIQKQYLDSFPHHFTIELGQSLGSLCNPNVVKRIATAMDCVIAFSPRGRYIVTGYGSFTNFEVWLWDYRTGEIVHKWEKLNSRIHSIVFSPNGESITASSRCPNAVPVQIITWNIDRNEISTDELSIPNSQGRSTISDNGHFLVIDGSDKISLYDITTRPEPKQLACFPCLEYGTKSIFSPNGDLLAFQHGSRKDVISFWSNLTQKVTGSLELAGGVHRMKFFPDGNRIGVGLETYVEIWDVLTRTKIWEFGRGPGYYLLQPNLAIFPDGQHLVVSSYRTIYIWNVSTGNLVQSFASGGAVKSVGYDASLSVSPDCKHIASVEHDDIIRVQEWESVSKTADVRDGLRYTDAQFSPGGGYLTLKGWRAGKYYLQILNTSTMSELTDRVQLRKFSFITTVSPNDQYIAYTATNGLCLWSIVKGEVVLDGPDCDFTALAFSSNSDRLISGDQNGSVIIWNTHTCQPSKIMTSEACILALAFSAIGTRFLVTYSKLDEPESVVEIHDSQSGKILKGPFTYHSSQSTSDSNDKQDLVAFSSNESRIVYVLPLEGFVLDAETGHILNTFKLGSIHDYLKLSLNRKYLWTRAISRREKPDTRGGWYDTDEKFWDIDEGVEMEGRYDTDEKFWDIDEGVEMKGQWLAFEPIATAFSNKPEEVLTVHETGAINLWNISTGTKTMTLMFDPEIYVYGPKVSSNGNCLVLVTKDSIKVWSLEGREECQAMSCVYENQAKLEIERLEEGIHRQNFSRSDEQERKEYASVAWQKALFSDSSRTDKDGWILGPNGELLFWIPEERRKGFWRPNMVLAAGPDPITRLNFEHFVHGSRWTECKKPLIC